jgi:hypothetical protein
VLLLALRPQTFRKLVADLLSQRSMLDEHRRAFQLFDVLGQGAIDFVSLKRVVRSLNLDIPDEELQVSAIGGQARGVACSPQDSAGVTTHVLHGRVEVGART